MRALSVNRSSPRQPSHVNRRHPDPPTPTHASSLFLHPHAHPSNLADESMEVDSAPRQAIRETDPNTYLSASILLTAALQHKVSLKRVSLELPRHSWDCNLTAAVEAAVKSPTVTHLTLKYGHLDAIRFSHVVANSLTNGSTLRALRLSFDFTLDFPLSILFDALKNNVSLKKLVIEGIPLGSR